LVFFVHFLVVVATQLGQFINLRSSFNALFRE